MRKSKNIRTYAFQLHDFSIKFTVILSSLTPRFQKKRVAFLQLDLRRNATRCTSDYNRFIKKFQMLLLNRSSFENSNNAQKTIHIFMQNCF